MIHAFRPAKRRPPDQAAVGRVPVAAFNLKGLVLDRLKPPRRRISGAVLLPAEEVVLHLVDLPPTSERQRRTALPFALEEKLAVPLDSVHVALCKRMPDNRVLAAVVARAVMEEAISANPDCALRPEQFSLPTPSVEEGQVRWSALRTGERVLVRVSDGTGFAVSLAALPAIWRSAGQPEVLSLGQALPDNMIWQAISAEALETDATDLAMDLRQGEFRPPSDLARPMRAVALIAACVAALHVALAWADLRAMRRVADALRTDTQALLAETLPDATVFDDPRILARKLAESRDAAHGGSDLIRLLDQASAALLGAAVPLNVDRLVWSADPTTLTLDVTAPDLEGLQSAEEELRLAGLSVSAGTATAGATGAQAALTLRPGGAR